MPEDRGVVVWTPGSGAEVTLAAAARRAGRADLAILFPGVKPPGDWVERLAAAAGSDGSIATASAMLTRHRWAPSPLVGEFDHAAAVAAVAARSGRLRPRISEPLAGCVLVRRTALDAAGLGGEHGSPAAELADFGERCTAVGLGHVLADDVLAAGEPTQPGPDEARALDTRYPHRPAARELDELPESPIGHAVLLASRGLDRLSVTIDGRSLGGVRAGTQVHALELIAALGRTGRVSLRVLTPPDLDPHARAAFDGIEDLTLLPYEVAAAGAAAKTDIVHRPSQVFSASDLALLAPLGHRLVVTHQDLIAYRIPGYHESVATWERYRRVTRDTLAGADRVVFFSEHARRDALTEDLIDPRAASVIAIGVDHRASLAGRGGIGRRAAGLTEDGLPFLLCLGADLPHKNQAFAVELARELRGRHGWGGRLVFAGPTGSIGAAAAGDEDPDWVVRVGQVSEEEKAWLLERAAAVVYATLYEGFGLLPFEAGGAGTPCVFAAQTSLAEILPESAATLVAWDARASADRVAPLLSEGPARSAHVEALREAADRYRWDDTAAAVLDVYEEVVEAAPRGLRRAAHERLFLEERLEETERLRLEEWRRHLAFREAVGSDGLGLVGPGGVLDGSDQRALLALMSKRAIRGPVMRLTRAVYRLAKGLRRRA